MLTGQPVNHQPDWTDPTADQSATNHMADKSSAGPEIEQLKPASSVSSLVRKPKENESPEETGAETEPHQTDEASNLSVDQQQGNQSKNSLHSGPPLVDVGAA